MSDRPEEVQGVTESSHPHLRAVDEEQAQEAGVERYSRADRRRLWLLAAAFFITAVLLVLQVQKSGELSAQVENLGSKLSATRGELAGANATITRYELRMDEVRGSVGALLSRVGALQELVDRDPAADPPGVPLSE